MEIAKWLVAFVAVYGFGGFVVDAIIPATSRQHLWNPAWRPHAKFHNCHGMVMGILGGALALAILFGMRPLTVPLFLIATAAAASYWLAMLAAAQFPGTAWYDPEFAEVTPKPFGLAPQQSLTYLLCGLLAIALALVLL